MSSSPPPAPLLDRLRRSSRISLLLGVAVALPFITSVGAAGLALRRQSAVDDAFRWVTRSSEVRLVNQQVLADLLAVESGQRGYVLTGSREFLAVYDDAAARVSDEAVRLAALVDTPEQQERARALSDAVRQRLDVAAAIVGLVAAGRRDEAQATVHAGRGREVTERARTIAADIDTAETGVLRAREASLTTATRLQAAGLTALVVTSTVALVVLMAVLGRMLRYEEVVRMCAWSRTIEYEGEWLSFEQYLQKRFGMLTSHGISPEAARKVRDE